MNNDQRLQLQNMIQENNVSDQTELIRQLKHSPIIRMEVDNLINIVNKYNDQKSIMEEGIQQCSFLYTYYTDIFNRIRKDEMDIDLLYQLLDALEKIETGETNFHEASFQVGTLLTEIYVKSAIKRSEKLENETKAVAKEIKEGVKDISWQHFKKIKKSLNTHEKLKKKINSKN